MMVSLWPWNTEDNSPASFEKTLSALAVKISKSQTHLDSLRSNQRRYTAIWTLYTSFVYLLGLVILVLVVGWKNWSIWEGSGTAGFPVWILKSYYTYRIDSATQRLEEQLVERFKTIEKLKVATKYNSTLELLEKYGAPKPKLKKSSAHKAAKSTARQQQRTSIGPPPTANIPRPGLSPNQNLIPPPVIHDPRDSGLLPEISRSSKRQIPSLGMPGPPEFAPNAFSVPPEYAQERETSVAGHWYDRMLDLLLGEDETLAKNRLALICRDCRLVNGQAPPGTLSIGHLGRWRCFACGSINGRNEEEKYVNGSNESNMATHTDLGTETKEDAENQNDQTDDRTAPETSSKESTNEVEMKK